MLLIHLRSHNVCNRLSTSSLNGNTSSAGCDFFFPNARPTKQLYSIRAPQSITAQVVKLLLMKKKTPKPTVISYIPITLIPFPYHLWDYNVGSASGCPLDSLCSFCALFSLWPYPCRRRENSRKEHSASQLFSATQMRRGLETQGSANNMDAFLEQKFKHNFEGRLRKIFTPLVKRQAKSDQGNTF